MEKEKADQAVEDHLRGSAEILQFPGGVVPQENGLMYAGSGKYLIDGWKKYVEEAFGISVNPLFSGHVSELYEFDIDKRDDEDHRPIDHPEKDCKDKHKKLVAISGYILKVKYHSFEVLSHDGEHYKIKYDDCTKALSCAQDYLLTAGDIVVLKGIKKEDGVILADQLTTIRRWFRIDDLKITYPHYNRNKNHCVLSSTNSENDWYAPGPGKLTSLGLSMNLFVVLMKMLLQFFPISFHPLLFTILFSH